MQLTLLSIPHTLPIYIPPANWLKIYKAFPLQLPLREIVRWQNHFAILSNR
jgi:hypothetical protein